MTGHELRTSESITRKSSGLRGSPTAWPTAPITHIHTPSRVTWPQHGKGAVPTFTVLEPLTPLWPPLSGLRENGHPFVKPIQDVDHVLCKMAMTIKHQTSPHTFSTLQAYNNVGNGRPDGPTHPLSTLMCVMGHVDSTRCHVSEK